MNFEINHTIQSRHFFQEKKLKMCEGISKGIKNGYSPFVRLMALPIALCHTLLTVAERISTLCECLIKGLGNIGGAYFSKKCQIKRGLVQLGSIPVYLFLSALVFPFDFVVVLPYTGATLLNPAQHFKNNAETHKKEIHDCRINIDRSHKGAKITTQ